MDVTRIAQPQTLTAEQQKAVSKLHETTQQFEGVFIGMLFKEMRKQESDVTLTGTKSNAEKIFTDMLDEQRAQSLAKSGSFGFGRLLEAQLRPAVIGNAARESKTAVERVRE